MSYATYNAQKSAVDIENDRARKRLEELQPAVINDLTGIAARYGIHKQVYVEPGRTTYRAFVFIKTPVPGEELPNQQWIGNEEKHLHRAIADIDAHYAQQIRVQETFRVQPQTRPD